MTETEALDLADFRGIGLAGVRRCAREDLSHLYYESFGESVTRMAEHFGCSHSHLGDYLDGLGVREKPSVQKHPMQTGTSQMRKGDAFFADLKREDADVVDKILEAAQAGVDAEDAYRVEQDEVHIRIDTDRPIALCNLGDTHWGHVGINPIETAGLVQRIAEADGLYSTMAGDAEEGMVSGCPDSARDEQVIPVHQQRKLVQWMAEVLYPRCLATMDGQHSFFARRAADFDSAREFAVTSGSAYFGSEGIIYLTVGETEYTVGVAHKHPGSSIYTDAAGAVKMSRKYGGLDVAMVADKHAPAIQSDVRYGNRWRTFIRTGTAKTRDRYAKSLGYLNSMFEVPLVILWPDHREILEVKHLHRGLDILQRYRTQ